MKKKLFLGILGCLLFSVADAQIGYQVALLNSATGEPRANETVRAEVTITDSNNGTVCSETQSVTSNDFGILSFTVGNADTFKDLGTRKLPLYISVTVNGALIGKSQILSVPVAEVANTLKSDFTLDDLCKTWILPGNDYMKNTYTFNKDGTFVYTNQYIDSTYGYIRTYQGEYEVEGNNIYIFFTDDISKLVWDSKGFHVIRWRNGAFDFSNVPCYLGR